MGTNTDHPILFKGDMVRAILDGRKTQTRRICRDQTARRYLYVTDTVVFPETKVRGSKEPKKYTGWAKDCGHSFLLPTKSPYDVPGDLLWVRETHWISTCGQYIAMPGGSRNNYRIPPDSVCSINSVSTDIRSSGRRFELEDGSVIHAGSPVGRKGEKDMLNCVVMIDGERRNLLFRRRSPLFMPKWACRLWLKVKSVRAEQVQDISEADAKAEGVAVAIGRTANTVYSRPLGTPLKGTYYDGFASLWDSINKKRGFGWDVNPFCWVVEFERTDK